MNERRWVLIVLDDQGEIDYCVIYEDERQAGAWLETFRRKGAGAILCTAPVVGKREKQEEKAG